MMKMMRYYLNPIYTQIRTYKYHYALKPTVVQIDKQIAKDEPRLFKPVQPIEKSTHCGVTYDPLIDKFTGIITKRGYKETARDIVRRTFAEIKIKKYKLASDSDKTEIEVNPLKIFHRAIKNCTPFLVIHSVRRGGFLYKVPAPPQSEAWAQHRAIDFIIETAKDKDKNIRIWTTLGRELVLAAHNEGRSIHKKQELHKECEENRAYANYRIF